MLDAAVIVTTYNWPEALRMTLRSIERQVEIPFEVVIADDGSAEETRQVVQETYTRSNLRWRHVRHNDKGIRQARIKNLGVLYSTAPYLIFIDHDVVLHPNFVMDHLMLAGKGRFLQGKRSFLPRDFSETILSRGIIPRISPFLPGLENRKNAVRLPRLGDIFARNRGFQTALRGCNLSMHRDDFLAVDGYDETFDQCWGREDSDICYRLFHSGVLCRNLWFSALQYHLYHPVTKNRNRDRLDEELDTIRQKKRKKAIVGFSGLSGEGDIVQQGDGWA
jgi:glycosyltransferase involved in cell wall biosynthesis